jgi:hypothetical protein
VQNCQDALRQHGLRIQNTISSYVNANHIHEKFYLSMDNLKFKNADVKINYLELEIKFCILCENRLNKCLKLSNKNIYLHICCYIDLSRDTFYWVRLNAKWSTVYLVKNAGLT